MDDMLLKRGLRANAVFSIFCSLILLSFTATLSKLFNDLASLYLQTLAAGLLLFAGYLLWVAHRSPIDTRAAKAITWMDWGWVIGSIILAASMSNQLSVLALDTILGVAAIVGLCAYTQGKGLKKLADPGASVSQSSL